MGKYDEGQYTSETFTLPCDRLVSQEGTGGCFRDERRLASKLFWSGAVRSGQVPVLGAIVIIACSRTSYGPLKPERSALEANSRRRNTSSTYHPNYTCDKDILCIE